MAKSRITVKTNGDIKKIIEKVNKLPAELEEAAKVALMQTTLKGESIAVKHMKNQDLRWTPLSKKYLKRKIKMGLSEKMLIASSTYLQSVTSFVSGGYGFVGVKRGVKDENGEEVANIALIMEYGSMKRGIKARKLWKPTLLELKKWIKESGIFVKEIKKKL